MPSVEKVMTPREVAEFLQLTPDTIYRYIREGKLVASRFGRGRIGFFFLGPAPARHVGVSH